MVTRTYITGKNVPCIVSWLLLIPERNLTQAGAVVRLAVVRQQVRLAVVRLIAGPLQYNHPHVIVSRACFVKVFKSICNQSRLSCMTYGYLHRIFFNGIKQQRTELPSR